MSVLGHDLDHLLESLVAADSTDYQDLFAVAVRHGALRDLREHGENRLLEREAEVVESNIDRDGLVEFFVVGDVLLLLLPPLDLLVLRFLVLQLEVRVQPDDVVRECEDPGKAEVHPLDDVGEGHKFLARLRLLFDVVTGEGRIREIDEARKPVDAVSDGDIEGFSEDPVPLV